MKITLKKQGDVHFIHKFFANSISFKFLKHVYTIKINQPTRCIKLPDLSFVVQIQLNMFRASSCPSSGAYKLQ